MGKVYESIDDRLKAWVSHQKMFFVATAPRDDTGHVNCSPKGCDTLRVIGPRALAYLDTPGSGVETIAHLRENGRIVIMPLYTFDGRRTTGAEFIRKMPDAQLRQYGVDHNQRSIDGLGGLEIAEAAGVVIDRSLL